MRKLRKLLTLCAATAAVLLLMAGCGAKTPEGSGLDAAASYLTEADGADAAQQVRELTDQGYELYVDTSIPDGRYNGSRYGTITGMDGRITNDLYCVTIAQEGELAQQVMDREEAAVYFRYGHMFCIADHDYQSFGPLKEAQPGDRFTVTDDTGGRTEYICTYVCEGKNTGHLYDDTETDIELSDHGALCLYTCTEGTDTIHMVFCDSE